MIEPTWADGREGNRAFGRLRAAAPEGRVTDRKVPEAGGRE
jgi:hypothetical protein